MGAGNAGANFQWMHSLCKVVLFLPSSLSFLLKSLGADFVEDLLVVEYLANRARLGSEASLSPGTFLRLSNEALLRAVSEPIPDTGLTR